MQYDNILTHHPLYNNGGNLPHVVKVQNTVHNKHLC